ncbi:Flavoprotein [Micromonospora rhizosphaerae]|uniref:Flavoprotein n=1 Tax=Micromonospora rhizosphaerae TaxID=568872 RepID=A0A1C6SHR2_9ACTN|nr:flavoprotein [Micromonospora rhizosphaerae]SCL29034.1 Flavoprotein [Micromonospora rhizosphaerae]
MTGGHLQIVVCGAGPAADVTQLLAAAKERAWTAAVTATPSARDFIDPQVIEAMTGYPARFTYQSSTSTRRILPAADALVIAPATYNSVNKIALGIADNYAMTSVAELIGRRIPTVIVPFVNSALAARAPFRRAVADLRHEQVRVLLGADDEWEPHPPGSGRDQQQAFPWEAAFGVAERLARNGPASGGGS